MKNKKMGKLIALVLSTAMIASCCVNHFTVSATQETETKSIVNQFKNPNVHAKGMFRFWLPDGSATREQLEKEITEIYEAGFGGIEIAHVPYAKNDSDDIGEYGWGSEKWQQTLIHIYEIAANLPGDFKVDVTINSAWPIALNTIDPNDEEASQDIQYAYTKIQNVSDVLDLPMPEQKLAVDTGSSFIFNNHYVAATIAQVKGIDEDGNITLDYDSMIDVSEYTKETGNTTPAGIPDENNTYVSQLYKDAGLTIDTEEWGSRAKLQDEQNYYNVDLSQIQELSNYSSAGDELQEGDWILFGFYRRGTGETLLKFANFFPLGASMPNVGVITDEFSSAASNALTDFWEENILNDHLISLMKAESGDFFEDSLENVCSTKFWNQNMIDSVQKYLGYDITPYLPFVMSSTTQDTKFISSEGNQDRFGIDVDKTLNELYLDEHIAELQNWARNTLDMGYRAQGYSTSGFYVDVGLASAECDVAEGESLAFSTSYDHFRAVSGDVHMNGKTYVSDEALADSGKAYALNWKDAVNTINNNYASGVNRLIIHGYPHANTENMNDPIYGDKDFWPGWHTFPLVAGAWGSRQPYWEDVHVLSDYIARSQAVLQNGTAKMDIAIFDTDAYNAQTPNGAEKNDKDQSNYLALLDNGYSYDLLTPGLLTYDSAKVTNGVLNESGPAYKALVVNNLPSISLESADALLDFAKAGLPIVLCGQIPSSVFGTDAATTGSNVTGTDEQIRETMQELLTYQNVGQVDTQQEVVSWMQQNGILPYASYSEPMVRTILRQDNDGTNYYYLYNNSEEEVSLEASLQGTGIPFQLDAWTGEITPIINYVQQDDSIHTTINLQAGQATFVAISQNPEEFGEVSDFHVVESNGDTFYQDGNIVLRTDVSGSYQTAFTDGIVVSTDITEIGDNIELDYWDLSLESWGPDQEANKTDLTISKKTTIDFQDIPLTLWKDLPVTSEQLSTLGVDSMENIIGIGTYCTTFELPENWDTTQGYLLNFHHNNDMVTEVIVNGQKLPAIDQSKDSVDIGAYLTAGQNTISVKLVSTMINRIIYENPNSQYSNSKNQSFGLLDVTLTPYKQVIIRSESNKDILDAVISYAENAKASDEYDNAIESVQKSFDAALENAKTVAGNAAATQEEVDAAWKTLLNEIHKLGFVAGDKTELASLMEAANEINAELDRYVEAGKAEFTAALEAAVAVYEDGDAMQAEVNEAADNLLSAMLNLRFKADKSILEDVLAEAGKVDANAYTAESYAALQAAVAEAKDVYNNENATQEEVDAAVTSVQTAMDNLVAVDGTPAETPTENNNTAGSQTGQESTAPKANAAKTGDFTPIAGLAAITLAGAALVLSRKKK